MIRRILVVALLALTPLLTNFACNHSSTPLVPAPAVHALDAAPATPGPQQACFSSAGHGIPVVHHTASCNGTVFPDGTPAPDLISVVAVPCVFFCDSSPQANCGGCTPQDHDESGTQLVAPGPYTFEGTFTVPLDPDQVTVSLSLSGGNYTVQVNGQPFPGTFTYDFTTGQVVGNPSSPVHLNRGSNQMTFSTNYDGNGCLEIQWNICVNWVGLPPTATPTPTDTPGSPTPTGTPTSSPTVTLSPTPTISATASPSPTPDPSPTVSPTGTPSVSPTVSTSATPTVSVSTTPDPTASVSATPDPTGTVGPTSTPTCPNASYAPQVTAYSQGDARWAATAVPDDQTPVPKVNTIKAIGCAVACYGIISGKEPGEVDHLLTENNLISDSGEIKDWNWAAKRVGLEDAQSQIDYSPDNLNSILANGSNVLVVAKVNFNGSSHYVVVTGVARNSKGDCDFTIDDPGNHSNHFLSSYATIYKIRRIDK